SVIETNILYTFGADASTVYAYEDTVISPTMFKLAVSNAGFAVSQQTADVVLAQGSLNDIEYANGLVYATNGSVYNPSTQSVQPPFSFLSFTPAGSTSNSFFYALDTSLIRAYFMTSDSPNGTTGDMTLEGFNLTTQAPTLVARFPASN